MSNKDPNRLLKAMQAINTPGPRNTAPVEVWMAVMIRGVTPPTVEPVRHAAVATRQTNTFSMHVASITTGRSCDTQQYLLLL